MEPRACMGLRVSSVSEWSSIASLRDSADILCRINVSALIMPQEKQTGSHFSNLHLPRISRDGAAKGIILGGLSLLLAAMFPFGEPLELEYKVGGIWAQKDLIALFPFPILRDEREYGRNVQEAKALVYPVFERDSTIEPFQLRKMGELFDTIEVVLRLRRAPASPADSLHLIYLLGGLAIPFENHDWEAIAGLKMENRLTSMRQHLASVGRTCWNTGVLDRPKFSLSREEIAIRSGKNERIVATGGLLDLQGAIDLLESDLGRVYAKQDDVVGVAYRIGVVLITPNIRYYPAASEAAMSAAVEAVPRTAGYVQENERIISKHERITEEVRLKLESYRHARADRGGEGNPRAQYVGTLLHVLVVVMLFGIYLSLFRKRIYARNGKLVLIGLLVFLQGFLAYVTREMNVEAPVEYLIVVPVASMLLTIIFDSRVGFYGTVIIAFVVAGIRGNDYSIAFASVVAGALSVYTVRDIRNRTQIFRSMTFIFLGYGVTVVALALERFEPLAVLVTQLGFVFVNALISPVLTYGLLIFFERVFKVTTDLTLIELSHFNHPLLRQLAEKAPGTYHHSMMIASLAEGAAAAIGANEILARVGASFHDIGKIVKPTYFVENQRGTRSRHDKLAPRMSSLIIQAHVKEGVTLAREHRLPEEVVDFIPMHHGTTRIEFFYNKALRLAGHSEDETKIEEINDQDYRYAGPKPQTKETGILMLADAIEASVRTLEDPSPPKLAATIDEVIKRRFEEGELDECPLTLKDLTNIREAFLRVLAGVYHARVKYPDVEKPASRKRPEPVAEDEGTVDGGEATDLS